MLPVGILYSLFSQSEILLNDAKEWWRWRWCWQLWWCWSWKSLSLSLSLKETSSCLLLMIGSSIWDSTTDAKSTSPHISISFNMVRSANNVRIIKYAVRHNFFDNSSAGSSLNNSVSQFWISDLKPSSDCVGLRAFFISPFVFW